MRKGLSLYIHIPFCNSKCNYCSFVSVVCGDDVKSRYIECLKKEIELRGKEFQADYQVTTIYIGGGTPSCIDSKLIKQIMQCIYKNFTVKNDAEITMELNPNSVTKEKISEYLFAGVNRFSIGLQCANPKVLSVMGRTHSAEDFIKAINIIHEAGINNISTDLILGYPNQTIDDIKTSLTLIQKLNIPHVSTYMLSVEDGTKLKNQIETGELTEPNEDEVVKQYSYCVEALKKMGIERYEVSNFAKPGFKCRHNQVYWKRWNYLGLGLASHSYLRHQRFANTSDLATYIGFLEKSEQIPVCESKIITDDEAKEEMVMLSLRTTNGLDTQEYQNEFGENFCAKNKATLAYLIKNGFLILDPTTNHIKATDSGFMVLNEIIAKLV